LLGAARSEEPPSLTLRDIYGKKRHHRPHTIPFVSQLTPMVAMRGGGVEKLAGEGRQAAMIDNGSAAGVPGSCISAVIDLVAASAWT
jgi:hypothetical protein